MGSVRPPSAPFPPAADGIRSPETDGAAQTGPGGEARGLFVALEGGDGSGKSTQLRLLAEALIQREIPVLLTREPGGSELGERIRGLVLDPAHSPVDARTEALLFAAARSAHVQRTIRPALADGLVVVTDRFLDSSVAYQGAGRRLGPQRIRELNLWAVEDLVPDLTVLLDVAEGTGRRRRAGGSPDRMELEPAAFHEQVRDAFLDLARTAPQRYLVLDASAPIDELARHILDRVLALLGSRLGARGPGPATQERA